MDRQRVAPPWQYHGKAKEEKAEEDGAMAALMRLQQLATQGECSSK